MHSFLEMIFCICARLCDDDILVVRVKKKEEIFFLFPFSRGYIFSRFRGNDEKISLFSCAFEKKVEKNNEKEQKTEQNENASLSPSHY